MGLDMYLHRRTYVGNNYREPEEQVKVVMPETEEKAYFKLKGKTMFKNERVTEIVELFGYWRKANAIHNWFIENCADGVDDCKEVYVSEEDLQKLLDTVNKVLEHSELVDGTVQNGSKGTPTGWEPILEKGKVIKDPSFAQEFLPTNIEGCFFGSADYDQWYYEDLVNTKKILEEAIAEGGEFYYEASW